MARVVLNLGFVILLVIMVSMMQETDFSLLERLYVGGSFVLGWDNITEIQTRLVRMGERVKEVQLEQVINRFKPGAIQSPQG